VERATYTTYNTTIDRPGVRHLGAGDVHIWYASLDVPKPSAACLTSILAPDEEERAHRFLGPTDRHRFVVGRFTLRRILAYYCEADPAGLVFRYGPNGKPFLDPSRHRAIRFNLSHAEGIALYAIAADGEVGIDVERRGSCQVDDAVARQYLSAREYAALRALPLDAQEREFLRCWTWREACLKAEGLGLAASARTVDYCLVGRGPLAVGTADAVPWRAARWRVRELDLGDPYVAAVAVHGGARKVSFDRWEEMFVSS